MTQNGTVHCGMPQRDQAREVTEICEFHKPNGDEEATLEPPAFGLRPDHVSALSDARLHEEEWRQGTLGDARSIKPSEGSRSRLRRTRVYANRMRRTGQVRVK